MYFVDVSYIQALNKWWQRLAVWIHPWGRDECWVKGHPVQTPSYWHPTLCWHKSEQCCRFMLLARVSGLQLGEFLLMHTNLQGWPCSVPLSSYSTRQEQHVLSHPVLCLVMSYICSSPARHLKVTGVEDEILKAVSAIAKLVLILQLPWLYSIQDLSFFSSDLAGYIYFKSLPKIQQ